MPDNELKIIEFIEFYSSFHSRNEYEKKVGNHRGIVEANWYGLRMDHVGQAWKGDAYKGDWRVFKAATVLDLGSGFEWEPPTLDKTHAPYFCRLMAGQDAFVWGVDWTGANSYDWCLYPTLTTDFIPAVMSGRLADLRAENASIQGVKFDIINCWNVISTFSPDPGMESYLYSRGIKISQVRQRLVEQAGAMLRPNGVLALDYDFYRKEGDDLVKLQISF